MNLQMDGLMQAADALVLPADFAAGAEDVRCSLTASVQLLPASSSSFSAACTLTDPGRSKHELASWALSCVRMELALPETSGLTACALNFSTKLRRGLVAINTTEATHASVEQLLRKGFFFEVKGGELTVLARVRPVEPTARTARFYHFCPPKQMQQVLEQLLGDRVASVVVAPERDSSGRLVVAFGCHPRYGVPNPIPLPDQRIANALFPDADAAWLRGRIGEVPPRFRRHRLAFESSLASAPLAKCGALAYFQAADGFLRPFAPSPPSSPPPATRWQPHGPPPRARPPPPPPHASPSPTSSPRPPVPAPSAPPRPVPAPPAPLAPAPLALPPPLWRSGRQSARQWILRSLRFRLRATFARVAGLDLAGRKWCAGIGMRLLSSLRARW